MKKPTGSEIFPKAHGKDAYPINNNLIEKTKG
jgi:hypothetical protein